MYIEESHTFYLLKKTLFMLQMKLDNLDTYLLVQKNVILNCFFKLVCN